MKDWVVRLDYFLKITGKNILTHAGNVSNEQAIDKAKEEYNKFKAQAKK